MEKVTLPPSLGWSIIHKGKKENTRCGRKMSKDTEMSTVVTENWQWVSNFSKVKLGLRSETEVENIINRNINFLWRRRDSVPQDILRALKHFWLSQMRAYYWHRVSRSVQDAATEQENHLPHPPETAPTCQHKLRNPELGHERPCMSCLACSILLGQGIITWGLLEKFLSSYQLSLVNLHRRNKAVFHSKNINSVHTALY